jgi:hypothetical protein
MGGEGRVTGPAFVQRDGSRATDRGGPGPAEEPEDLEIRRPGAIGQLEYILLH